MKCDRCGKNDATFYYKSNINGRVTETHLCQDCARQMGYAEADGQPHGRLVRRRLVLPSLQPV